MAGYLIESKAKQLELVGATKAPHRRSAGEAPGRGGTSNGGVGGPDRVSTESQRHSATKISEGRLRHFLRLRRDTARTNPEIYDPLAAFLGVSMSELSKLMLRSDVETLRPAPAKQQR